MADSIFFKYKSDIEPADGSILVSEPHLPDINFDRTVVLLCRHNNQEGSFGFVLNKQSNVLLEDVLKDARGIKIPVFIGGPVEQNTLHFIHNDDTLTDSQFVAKDLYWGGDFGLLLSWLREGLLHEDNVKIFLGYSGWSPGQLQDEIEQNSWMVFNPEDHEFVFKIASQEMWQRVLQERGGRYKMYAKYPVDPRLN